MKLFSILIFALLTSSALADKPNVIIIMTDDQGNNLGYEGNPHVLTPHIDRVAMNSVRLGNFHQMPMCTASRAALMTGKYAEYTGAWRTSLGRTLMRGENYTIAEAFKANGYTTGQFGKWHLGDNYPMRPMDQGFDEVVALGCGAVGQIGDYWGNDYFDDTYVHNGKYKKYEGYCTDVFFNETMRFIKETKDKPFFIYLAPNVTHLPLIVADKYSQRHIANGINPKLATFYGMVDNLDENFGRLMECLKKEGELENTILLYTTDDGIQGVAASSSPDTWFKGMRGKKGSKEEGGHRVSCFMTWPAGNIGKAGSLNNTLTSVLDIYPSMLDLCGIKLPKGIDFNGRSFKTYLTKPLAPEDDERVLFFYYFNPKKLDDREKINCVIWKNWRLLSSKNLYDISKDLMQENDVAAEHPEVVEKLVAAFDAYHAKGKALVQAPVRIVVGAPAAPVVAMTSQDAYATPVGNPPKWKGQSFTQRAPEKLEQSYGPYMLDIARDGNYTIKLSRYPLYTGMTFSDGKIKKGETAKVIEKVRMTIAGQTLERQVSAKETYTSFTLDLKKGPAALDTAFLGDALNGIAYFVTVEYNEKLVNK